MSSRPAILGSLAVAALLFAPFADAKAPAYFVSDVGFKTQIHGTSEGERKETCLDPKCKEKSGVLVAHGESLGVTTDIREHKRGRELKKAELEAFAGRLVEHQPEGREIRISSGRAAAGHNALEQWSVQGGCGRLVTGRVLLSLGGKIVEVETRATMPSDAVEAKKTLGRMHEILRGVRIRRLGDEPLDPIADPPPAKDVIAANEKCLRTFSRKVRAA